MKCISYLQAHALCERNKSPLLRRPGPSVWEPQCWSPQKPVSSPKMTPMSPIQPESTLILVRIGSITVAIVFETFLGMRSVLHGCITVKGLVNNVSP